MTDMRNFEPTIRAESAFIDSNAIEANEPVHNESFKENYVLEDSGGLGQFHHKMDELEEEGAGRGKAISALIVALMLGAAGAYAYSMWTPQSEAVATTQAVTPKVAAAAPM